MRETTTTVVMTCDACGEPAIGAYTVGVGMGEVPVLLHVIDVCERHAEQLHTLSETTERAPLLGQDETAPAGRARRRQKPRHRCRICGSETQNRAALIHHVWSLHTAARMPEPTPTRCPECDQRFVNGRAMALHRKTHGYDALETAYAAALKGPRGPKS